MSAFTRHDIADVTAMTLTTGLYTALPDYVSSPARRFAVRAALVTGMGLAVGAVQLRRESDAELRARHVDLLVDAPVEPGAQSAGDTTEATVGSPTAAGTEGPESQVADLLSRVPEQWRPAATTGGALAVAGIVVGSIIAGQKLDDALARWFAGRGVARPYSAVGLLWAATTVATYPLIGRIDPTTDTL